MTGMTPIEIDLLANFKKSARDLVMQHGKVRLNGKVASDQTMKVTLKVAASSCERLWKLGFRLSNISKLEDRHVRALIRDWYSSGLEPKTIQNNVSRLRQICRWINKSGIIPSADAAAHFLPEVDPKAFHVKTVATHSKSWSENGINVVNKIKEADAIDRRFGAMLRLGLAFGLRKKEQLRIVPAKADAVTHLLIRDNIGKSGKDREIQIIHSFQRAMLEHAKRIAGSGRHLGWPGRTFEQNQGRYAYYMKKIGVTGRDADCVGHGLRAEYAENMSMLMGLVPATLGGTADQMGKARREEIQMRVSEGMGHHRINVTGAYLGSFRARPVLVRKGDIYLEHKGFKASVKMDFERSQLSGLITAEKGEDIEFSGATTEELRAQFHRVVEQIISEVRNRNERGGLESADESAASP